MRHDRFYGCDAFCPRYQAVIFCFEPERCVGGSTVRISPISLPAAEDIALLRNDCR
jgi:hypothetical protein